jgi:hypothetical protein
MGDMPSLAFINILLKSIAEERLRSSEK